MSRLTSSAGPLCSIDDDQLQPVDKLHAARQVLTNRHTRREAGPQNHGSPATGRSPGYRNSAMLWTWREPRSTAAFCVRGNREVAAGGGTGMNPLGGLLKRPLWHVAAFSFAVNLLLLVPALFMLQVFDRVLVSQSRETLAMLL